MPPLRLLDNVVTRDGRELVLYQRGDAFYIQIDDEDLMSSRAYGSEAGLSQLGIDALGPHPSPRVLVGGLGMGFTLRAALDTLGSDRGQVVVAEFFPAVVEWNRGPLARLAGHPLDDPRVRVAVGDVAERLDPDTEGTGAPFDVVLLDVDNGPEGLTLESNRYLYTTRGIARLHQALSPDGVLAVWSASPAPSFEDRLTRSGFTVSRHRLAARSGGKGGSHVVILGRKA